MLLAQVTVSGKMKLVLLRNLHRWEKRVIGPQQVPWAMIALILGTCLVLGIVANWAVALLGDSETEDYPRMDNKLIWVLPNRKPKEQSEDITAASDSALKKLETTEQTNTKYSKNMKKTWLHCVI